MKITPQVSFGKWSPDKETKETLEFIRNSAGESGEDRFNQTVESIEKNDATVGVERYLGYRNCLIYDVKGKEIPDGGFTATYYPECLSPLQSLIQVNKRITPEQQ